MHTYILMQIILMHVDLIHSLLHSYLIPQLHTYIRTYIDTTLLHINMHACQCMCMNVVGGRQMANAVLKKNMDFENQHWKQQHLHVCATPYSYQKKHIHTYVRTYIHTYIHAQLYCSPYVMQRAYIHATMYICSLMHIHLTCVRQDGGREHLSSAKHDEYNSAQPLPTLGSSSYCI